MIGSTLAVQEDGGMVTGWGGVGMASCLPIRRIECLGSSGVTYGMHSAQGVWGGMPKLITTTANIDYDDIIGYLRLVYCRSCTFSYHPSLPVK